MIKTVTEEQPNSEEVVGSPSPTVAEAQAGPEPSVEQQSSSSASEGTVPTSPNIIAAQENTSPPDEKEDDKSQDGSEFSNSKSSGGFKAIILPFLLGFVLGGLIVGGVFYWKTSVEGLEEETATPAPTISPTAEPKSEEEEEGGEQGKEEEEVDLSEYSVQILNGTGGTGVARAAKEELDNEGFGSLVTGNASSFEYEETEVALKKDVPGSVYEVIKDALKDKYDVVKAESAVDEDSEYDVVITVGETK